jgi:uncharacterized repeat protein (TIGR02543 family)
MMALALLVGGCSPPTGSIPPTQHTITFNSHGGSAVAAITANEGTAVDKPADPARDGYAFAGWFSAASGGTLYSWPHILTGAITMHAHWEEDDQPPPAQHAITFDSHGGSAVGTITAAIGTAVDKPADPTRDGHAFAGWYSAASGGTLYSWPHTLTGAITMHAHWQEDDQPQPAQHTLAFDSHGGTAVAAITANEGTLVAKPADPTRAGYAFAGWFSAASGGTLYSWPYTLTGAITMHAHWQEDDQPLPARHTIAFDSHGGAAVAAITANEGTLVAKPADPTRADYTFAGWFSAASGGTQYAWPYTLTGDVTMHAQWIARHTITYDTHGGSTVTAYTANEGTLVAKPADPTRADYTFAGWFSAASGGTPYSWPHTLSGKVTMHAQWIARHTITFDSHSGSAVAAITANAGTPVAKPADPTRAAYTFAGWFSAASGGMQYSWPHTLTGKVTMHAQWQDNTLPPPTQYTITFDTHGGSAVTALMGNMGTPVAKPADPTRADYTFAGWYSAAGGGTQYAWPHTLTGNVTMHAQWTPIPHYTITFDSHSGSTVAAITANTGTAVPKPADPTRTDYTFAGWYSAASGGTLYTWPHTLTGNITMHAQWAPIQYTIAFDSHSGSTVAAITANTGTAVPKPADPTRTGYTFAGWFSAASWGTLYTWPHTLTGNVTMHAQWAPLQYTITFDSHSGSTVAAITANVGTAVPKPADPTRTGYTFAGWFSAASGGTQYAWPYTLTGNVTMHAQWQDNTLPPPTQYTITFDTHGGSTVTALTGNTGTSVAKPADSTRAGHTFAGWFSAASGGTQYAWPHTLTGNVTMHAQWIAQYTITFDSHSGSTVAAITANTGTAVSKPADSTWAGHTFAGWFSAASGGTQYAWPHTLTGNVTMHAQWAPLQYTITFNSQSGSTVAAITANTGTAVPKPADPTRTGYTFAGWFSAASGGTSYTWPHSLTGNVTMHAQWVAQYTITFNSQSGSTVAAITANTGTAVPKPADPTRAAYTFAGWFSAASGGTLYTWPHTLTGNVTMHARWTAIPYSITYYLNGGTNGANPASYTIETPGITLAAAARANYTFGGWYENSALTGSAVASIPAGSTGGKTFYARWAHSASVNVSVWVNEDDETILVSDDDVTISKTSNGNPYSFTATVVGGYTGVQWYFEGFPITGSRGAAQSIAINAAEYNTGTYILGVTVTKNGALYSTDFRFTVTN